MAKNDLQNFLNSLDQSEVSLEFQSALKKAINKLNQLDKHREKVDALAISPQEGIDFYTELHALMIDAVRTISAITPHGDVARLVSAYVNFMEAKEKVGIERATMSAVFAEDHFPSLEIFHRFSAAVAAQKTLIYIFKSYASPEQINFYNQKMSDPVVAEVEKMRDIVFIKFAEKSLGQVDAGHWFDTMTSKINLMKEVENKLAADLNSRSAAIGETARKKLWQYFFGAILTLVMSVGLAGYVLVSITRSLRKLQKRVENIMHGDYSYKSNIHANDELGQLCRAFDLMTANAQEAKASLEQRVKEQTMELTELKTGLEKTVDSKTIELKKRLEELEEFKKLTIGRELKMVELKKEIEALRQVQGKI